MKQFLINIIYFLFGPLIKEEINSRAALQIESEIITIEKELNARKIDFNQREKDSKNELSLTKSIMSDMDKNIQNLENRIEYETAEAYLLGFAEGLYSFDIYLEDFLSATQDEMLTSSDVEVFTQHFINKLMPISIDAKFLINEKKSNHPISLYPEAAERVRVCIAKRKMGI